MRRKWTYKGEDITWVIDQVTKVFKMLGMHLATKKQRFPEDQEIDAILNAAKGRIQEIKEEHNDS